MKRCVEIQDCHEKIRFYRRRLSKLKEEQRRFQRMAALQDDAASVWNRLPKKVKWDKQVLLATLRSKHLPSPLKENNWNSAVPRKLRHDRDLFLARLEREDFKTYLNERNLSFCVPETLQDDKQVMLKVILVYPEIVDTDSFTSEMQNDVDIARALLRSDTFLFAFNLSKFSEGIRSNPRLMLEMLQRDEGGFGFREMGAKLRNDRAFVLKAADMAPRLPSFALKALSQRLRADKDVVLAFVKKSGSNLAHASYPLRRDMEVVRAACSSDPAALQYSLPSRTKKLLTKNKQFMLNLFRSDIHRIGLPEKLWKICAPALKKDREVVVAAVLCYSLDMSNIPEEFTRDRSFWKDIVPTIPRMWYCMPPAMQEDVELATLAVRNVRSSADYMLAKEVMSVRPDVVLDKEAIIAMSRQLSLADWLDIFFTSPLQIANDKEIMMEACRNYGDVLELVESELLEDRDIIEAALARTPHALAHVPDFVQHMYPDLIAKAIRDTPRENIWQVYDWIDESCWAVFREIALAWLLQGGDFLEDEFPEEFDDDPEVFLLIAEHNWVEFWSASDSLLGNKEFMMQVVEKNGVLLREGVDGLDKDFDLALNAFAGTRDLVSEYDHSGSGEDFRFLVDFARKVRKRLESHESFTSFLCGMKINPETHCKLSLLEQGRETSMGFCTLIAEYVGIPIEKELRLLRQASVNLARWGF